MVLDFSGELNSKETIEQYREVVKGARLWCLKFGDRFNETPSIHFTDEINEIFFEPEKNKLLIQRIYAQARETYGTRNSGWKSAAQADGPIHISRDERPQKPPNLTIPDVQKAISDHFFLGLGPQGMQKIRNIFNEQASSHLRGYTSKHKEQ